MAGKMEITSTGQMSRVATAMEEQITRYDTAVDRLYEYAQELDGMWEGESRLRFMQQMETDREKFTAMRNMLVQYMQTLRENIQSYEDAESRAVDAVNRSRK